MSILWSKIKKLFTLGKINSFYISTDTRKIKISDNGYPLSLDLSLDQAE